MYKVLRPGMFSEVEAAVHGEQHKGLTPGGPMDRFSWQWGRNLLGNHKQCRSLEIILPPRLQFTEEVYFVLTGALFNKISLQNINGEQQQTLQQGVVYKTAAGDILQLQQKVAGFRSYLTLVPASSGLELPAQKTVTQTFEQVANWPHTRGFIRALPGPEFHLLKNPDIFFASNWKVSRSLSKMGMFLEGARLETKAHPQMISAPVSDGTVQLSPDGPCILLRHRQTIGGYPRIFNVISADLDLLAQCAPNNLIQFIRTSEEEAKKTLLQQQSDLRQIKNDSIKQSPKL